MSVIYILVGASITIAIGFLIAFIWSVKNGQYEDDYTPSVRMLFDDLKPAEKESTIPAEKAPQINSSNIKKTNPKL